MDPVGGGLKTRAEPADKGGDHGTTCAGASPTSGVLLPGKDLYGLLDVRREASAAEVRRSYEMALARAHRDGANRHMLDLVNAFEVLGDERRRRMYDQSGIAVLPERVPNTHGRAVPFRGSTLGRTSPAPKAPTGRLDSPVRGRAVVASLLTTAVALGALGLMMAMQLQAAPLAPTGSRPAPGVRYVCATTKKGHAFSLRVSAGARVVCANGAVPRRG